MSKSKHLWIIWIFIPIISAQNGIYTIIAPKTLRPNLPYNVGVSLDANSPVNVIVSIRATLNTGGSSSSTQQSVIEPGRSQLITLQVGDLIEGGIYNLTVRGSGGINFENTTELDFSPKSSSIIVQTDKPIYKPGELVRFRVLYLDRSLRPKGPGPLDISIKDSQGNVIKFWKNAIAQRGLFSNDIQLSSDPNLGDWSLEVKSKSQREIQQFTIAEYVLPKFNVDVDLPTFATFTDSKITARIRSKYVYGKPVKGEAIISAYPVIHSNYIQPVFSGVVRKTTQINGVADVEFDFTKELGLTDDYQRLVNIEVVVTESLTGRKQNATKTLTLHKYPYKMEVIKGTGHSFKPGLPYTITIKISSQDDIPIADSRTNALAVKHGFSYNHEEYKNSTYSIPPNGLVTLTFQTPVNDSIVALGIEATYKDLTEWFPTVQRASSPSNTYIQAAVLTKNPKVNQEVEIEVQSTIAFSSINYELLGRGDLLISKQINVPGGAKSILTFRILLPPNSAPMCKLVVYFVYENEIVADSTEFHVTGSLDNFLNLTLTREESEPGKEVDILISAKPNSLIGLKGIDQSVLLLKKDKDVNMETVEEQLNSWGEMGSNSLTGRRGSDRFKRSLFNQFGASTASQVFEESGVVILTNAVVHQQPPIVFYRANFLDDSVDFESMDTRDGGSDTHDVPRIRKNFPETFIWDELTAGFDGRTSLRKTIPDTITNWVISGFSLDPVYGLGVSEAPYNLRVFRPFFISLNVPYFVIKGESLSVQVLVHNYLSRDTEAVVSLDNSNSQFAFTSDENEIDSKLELFREERVRVKANSVSSVSFMITPLILGPVDLNVKANSRIAGDALSKPLMVRPPGQTQKYNKAYLVDLRSGRSQTLNITTKFPPKRVALSDFVKIAVVADILGPSISNLDKMLELPFGCGEQNLIKFVPDIVILEYLQTTRQLTEPIRQKAISFLETGYQKELSFRHDDGSYSAFGKNDPSGSTWLTAFVVRSFIAAKPHIYIDQKTIQSGIDWLIEKQSRDGSFPEVGKLFDTDLSGGAGSTKGVALTAYVALALIEANNDPDFIINSKFSTAINTALDYVARGLEGSNEPYAISISTYAFNLANHPFKDVSFNLLENMAKYTDDGENKYWEVKKTDQDEKNPWTLNTKPMSVEITSYALLTYLQRNLIGDSLPVVKWLLQQRNAEGGFISTQDTIVGISALARFARLINTPYTDLQLNIKHEGGSHRIQVNRDNSIVLQEIKLPSTTRWVTVESSGSGLGIVQLSWGYNIDVVGAWPLFNIDPQVDKISTANQLHLSICTKFVGAGSSANNESNMAVMTVNVPSGFQINTDRLPNLLHYPQIKKFETEDSLSKLVVYFDSLNRSEVCPTVSAYRVYPVARQARSYVTIYDYYDNSRRARQFYNAPRATICDICEEPNCSNDCLVAKQQKAEEEERERGNASSANFNYISKNSIIFYLTAILIQYLH